MNDIASTTVDIANESRCIACFESIQPQAKLCPHCHSSQKPERWSILGQGLKWLGGATAVISLVIGMVQINELLQSSRERAAAVGNLVRAAELQLDGDDMESALMMVQQALELDPASSSARDLQVQIAAAMVRTYYGFGGFKDIRDVLDPLIPVLHRGAVDTNDESAADMLAHIGWSNHLRSDRDFQPAVLVYFERALKLDPDNVFAHTFWANWCLTNKNPASDCGDNLKSAISHYSAAQKSGRYQEYLNDISSFSLYATYVEGAKLYFVSELARSLREGLKPDEAARNRFKRLIYDLTTPEDKLQELLTHIAPRDLLAVLESSVDFDLSNRRDWPNIALRGFLLESSGDTSKALAIYPAIRSMIRQEEVKGQGGYSDLRKRIDVRLAKHMNVRPGRLGIKQQSLTQALREMTGVKDLNGSFVAEISKGGAAEQAGIKKGDVIFAIDGQEIKSGWRDVLESTYAPSAGDEVSLLVFREGKKVMLEVKLGEKKLASVGDAYKNTAFSRLMDKTLYGTQEFIFTNGELVLVNLNDELQSAFNPPENMEGVLVFYSNRHYRSFRSGDLIRKVAGQTVKNITEFKAVIQQLREKGVLTVLINRVQRGEESVVTLEL